MNIHYFQHVEFEGLGSIEKYFLKNNHSITSTKFYEDYQMPDMKNIDFLIIVGGSMSVNDEVQFQWLKEEKEFIRKFIKTNKPILGICLGAQLIASALGSGVYPNETKEIGWFDIFNYNGGFQFPAIQKVFHWHGETFDLPKDSICLASSKECKNQAFQIGKNVIGLQFHLETTPQSAKKIVENCKNELEENGKFIQSEEEILSAPKEDYDSINLLMNQILDYLIKDYL